MTSGRGNHEVGEKMLRFVEMLQALSREPLGTTELAARLGVTPKTVQRYLRVLRSSSINIETIHSWRQIAIPASPRAKAHRSAIRTVRYKLVSL